MPGIAPLIAGASSTIQRASATIEDHAAILFRLAQVAKMQADVPPSGAVLKGWTDVDGLLLQAATITNNTASRYVFRKIAE